MRNQSITFCIAAFVLSMFPLHYMPSIYANSAFMASLLKGVDVKFYMYSFLLGFIVSGFLILSKNNTLFKKRTINIVICVDVLLLSLAIIFTGWLTVIFRFLAGCLSCPIYSKVYFVAFHEKKNKISIVGKVLGVSSIILEGTGFLSGLVSNTNNSNYIVGTYITILILVAICALLSSANLVDQNTNIIRRFNKYDTLIRTMRSLYAVLPSILAFTSFFLYIINIGNSASNHILPVFVGTSLLFLAVGFPLGTFFSTQIVKLINYKPSLLAFCGLSILGILIQILGIHREIWYVLSLGSCIMAMGNGGLITVNSTASIIESEGDLSRPPLLYMLVSMAISLLFGTISFTFSNNMSMSFIMITLYIFIILFTLFFCYLDKETANAINT